MGNTFGKKKKHSQSSHHHHHHDSAPKSQSIEDVIIDKIVQRYLENELINNPKIPDFVEKAIYRNTLKVIIGTLKDTLETSHFDLLDHRITLKLTPLYDGIPVVPDFDNI